MTKIIRLKNGITLITEHLPYFRTASAGIYVNAGSAFENSNNKGISHMLEHMLFKGTKTRSAADIANETVLLGDDINAYTSKEYTVFYGTTLGTLLGRMLDLFADMLLEPVFDAELLEKEKQIVCEEIAMYEDSPEDIVHDRLQEAVYGDHPLGYIISGDAETVRNIRREDILAYKDRFYTGNNMIISIAGNYDESVLEDALCRFEQLPSGENSEKLLTVPEYNKTACLIEKNIDLFHMNFAFPSVPASSDEQYTAAVFHSAFGGSNNSLLFRTIREELSLAYSVYSYNSAFRACGLSQIDVTVDRKDAVKTVDEIIKITENIKSQGFEKEQIELCRKQTVIELLMGGESVSDKMSLNARTYLTYGALKSIDEQAARIELVTPKMVQEFAEKYLDKSIMSFCLVGKRGKTIFKDIKNLLEIQ